MSKKLLDFIFLLIATTALISFFLGYNVIGSILFIFTFLYFIDRREKQTKSMTQFDLRNAYEKYDKIIGFTILFGVAIFLYTLSIVNLHDAFTNTGEIWVTIYTRYLPYTKKFWEWKWYHSIVPGIFGTICFLIPTYAIYIIFYNKKSD